MAIENYEPFVRHDVGASMNNFALVYEQQIAALRESGNVPIDIYSHAVESLSLLVEIRDALFTDRLTITEEENN